METLHIVITLVLLFVLFYCSKSEGYKNFCGNCHDLTLKQCEKCDNCGVRKLDSGCKSCAQGDEAGPYFHDDAVDWEYLGETPNKKCRNYDKYSPLNCGYEFPYNKRVVLHQKFAAHQNQLGTKAV